MIVGIFILVILTVLFIVYFERAMRKILINYPKRQVGNKMYGGESSHLPLKINTAGVIPAIFASALLLLPVTVSNFGFSDSDLFLKSLQCLHKDNHFICYYTLQELYFFLSFTHL